MKVNDLIEFEINVLKLVRSYGVDLDLSGPRVSRAVQAAARELLHKGYLTGNIKALSLTVRGDTALSRLPQESATTPEGE